MDVKKKREKKKEKRHQYKRNDKYNNSIADKNCNANNCFDNENNIGITIVMMKQ